MELMKIRIHFFKDMKNHTYFFTDPIYDSAVAEKFMSKLKQPDLVKRSILTDLSMIIAQIPQAEFQASEISKSCTKYLKENASGLGFKNEDVFFLLRFAITGNPVGAPVGDICEIIG